VSECPVYVRSIAIATGTAIPTSHDNNRTNREVNRSVMDEECLAASPDKKKMFEAGWFLRNVDETYPLKLKAE